MIARDVRTVTDLAAWSRDHLRECEALQLRARQLPWKWLTWCIAWVVYDVLAVLAVATKDSWWALFGAAGLTAMAALAGKYWSERAEARATRDYAEQLVVGARELVSIAGDLGGAR